MRFRVLITTRMRVKFSTVDDVVIVNNAGVRVSDRIELVYSAALTSSRARACLAWLVKCLRGSVVSMDKMLHVVVVVLILNFLLFRVTAWQDIRGWVVRSLSRAMMSARSSSRNRWWNCRLAGMLGAFC